MDAHAAITDFRMRREFGGEGMVVGSEEADAADVSGDVVEDGLGDSYAIVAACAAAELVKDDEGSGSSFRKNFLRFCKLDKEGGLCGKDVIVGAEAGHYSVHWRQAGMAGRDKAAYLGHNDCDTRHTEDGGFAGCVGTSEEVDIGGVGAELNVVRNEVCDVGEHAGVAEVFEFNDGSGVVDEDGTAGRFAKGGGGTGETDEAV